MPFASTEDLRTDALRLAGEPLDSKSEYYASIVLDYMNFVFQTLIMGGTLGIEPSNTVRLEAKDWYWARKHPRGSIRMPERVNKDAGTTITVTQDSTTVTFSSGPTASVAGYHVIVPPTNTAPAYAMRINAHTAGATTATADRTYPYATFASTDTFVVQLEYDLPSDFLRFASALFPIGRVDTQPYTGIRDSANPIDLLSADAMEAQWPVQLVTESVPAAASLVAYDGEDETYRLRVSHYVDTILDAEFEYVTQPKKLNTVSVTATFSEADPDTITRASGSWIDDGFEAGQRISVTGTVSNNGEFRIASLSATVLTLNSADTLTAEASVASTQVAVVPPLPLPHRRIISYGAAFLILADKTDSQAVERLRQFSSLYDAMLNEQDRQIDSGSRLAGVTRPRLSQVWQQRRVRTDSGLIIW